jgi:DNA-binding transcriptional LysR family regulator
MELRQLATFVAVAEEGSFTRASDRLRVVQSAVSATIRKLERELGVTLFDRSTHRVELADAGDALLPEARRVLAAADAAREAVDRVRGGLRGTVRLGTMQAQAMRAVSIPALLAAFRAEHPDVRVEVSHAGGSATIAERVREGRLDVAFLALPERRPAGLSLTPLAREPIMLACPPGHRLAGRDDVELSMLAEEAFAESPPGWGTRLAVDRAFAAAGVRRSVTYEVNDAASLIEFVRHGLAVAMIPPSFAADVPAISFVAIRHHAPVFETSIASPANRPLSAAASALRELAVRLAD